MAKYMLRGTISIRIEASMPPKIAIELTPVDGFVTPEKKKAIAFKIGKHDLPAKTASLIKFKGNDEKVVVLSATHLDRQLRAVLYDVAARKMPVELHLDSKKLKKIVGFVFPCN